MIRLADKNDINTVYSFCRNSAAGCRISASLSAYGTEMPFHNVWLYYDEKSELSGIIGKINSAVTVYHKSCEFPEEIRDFLSMQADVSEILFEQDNNENIIMKYSGTSDFNKKNENILINNARDIYSVLKNSNDIKATDEIYVDISHRIRHGCLLGITAYCDNKPVSCGCAHISENNALITAVETLSEYRRQGFASLAVLNLCSMLKDKNIFLMCKSELMEFYKKTGFEKCGGYIIESAVF